MKEKYQYTKDSSAPVRHTHRHTDIVHRDIHHTCLCQSIMRLSQDRNAFPETNLCQTVPG